MAAGENFTLKPYLVITSPPSYYNIITQSESAKKEYMNIASTPIQFYTLYFILTNTNRDILLNHYKDNYGGYHNFLWASVPEYINSGANITGRWVDNSLSMNSTGGNHWQISVVFEVEV